MMFIKHLSKTCFFIILIAFIGGCSSKTSKSSCEGVTCSDHGTCVVENGAAKCNCSGCYLADKLECKKDPSACSGHGMCVDDNGTATCQCDDGYHAEGLSCIKNYKTCLEGCTVDDDCFFGSPAMSFYAGYPCDNKRCVECTQDDQCIARLSGWWNNPVPCLKDEDCDPQKCIKVIEGPGRCVDQAQDCSKLGYGYTAVSKTDINGTDTISVCAVTNTKCIAGKCFRKECGSNADCVATYSKWLLQCSSKADCIVDAPECVYLASNETIGYCATIPDSNSSCRTNSLTKKDLPRFENRTTNVTVCVDTKALSDATCNNGTCWNPCKEDSHCSNQLGTQTPYCETSTGRCICKNDTDCTNSNYDKCFTESGSCGCSSESACTVTLLKNVTWVCATQ